MSTGLIKRRERKKASDQICQRIGRCGIQCFEEFPGKFILNFSAAQKSLSGKLIYYGKGNWDLDILNHDLIQFNSTSVNTIVSNVRDAFYNNWIMG